MAKEYKRAKLDPAAWRVLTGQLKHELELPFCERIDLWVEWRSNSDVTCWLLFTDGTQMPWSSGSSGHASIVTENLLSVVLECTKKTDTIAASVSYIDLSDQNWKGKTKKVIVPPRTAQIDLGSLLTARIKQELEGRGILPSDVPIDEEDDLEDELPADEFGPGYMESDEKPQLKPAPKRKATMPEPTRGVPDDDPKPGTAPDSAPVVETK